MHKFVVLCVLVIVSTCIAQKTKGRPKIVVKPKGISVNTDIERCRTCSRYFKGDNRQLCNNLFCSKDKTRKNLKSPQICSSCTRKFTILKKQQTCKEVFCAGPTTVDPTTFPARALAFTVDMLCAYCRTINNYNCLVHYGCPR